MARYRKIDPRTWKDEKFRALSSDEKLIAFYVLTAQSNRIGLFNFSPAMAAEDLETLLQTFLKGFENVCQQLRWMFDQRSRVVYIPTWFKYNCPENPNVLKSCLQDLHDLPETPLLEAFATNLTYLPQTFHATFLKGCGQPSANQEQEQEQEHIAPPTTSRARARAAAPTPPTGRPGELSRKLVEAVRSMQVEAFHCLAEPTLVNQKFWTAQLDLLESTPEVSVYACLRDVDAHYASCPDEWPRNHAEAARRMKAALEVAVRKLVHGPRRREKEVRYAKRAAG